MPRAAVMPNVECALEEVPCKTNPLGVKGIGESGTIGAPPAVINAVIDALRPLGVDTIDMPATPLRVWETIQRAKKNGAAAYAALAALSDLVLRRSEGSRLEGWAACGAILRDALASRVLSGEPRGGQIANRFRGASFSAFGT